MQCQKVLKMLENIPYLSVGLDVGADFTWMSIMLPNGTLIGKPFKILHSDPQSRELAVTKIKEAQEAYSLKSRCFLESTGIYHIPLLCFLRDKGFDCRVMNPIITKNSTNMNVRKLHNDKFDSKKAAKAGMFRTVQEQILYLYKDKKQPLLLAVDEAQYLSTGILEDIKTLMNYGYDSLNRFTLILRGEPHLNSTLKKHVHEALRQRITVHYNFSGLPDSEVAQYILHKIACAGGTASIIDQAALSAVHSHSQGSPRLVDNLMTYALTLGAQMDKKVIDTDVMASVSSQNLG